MADYLIVDRGNDESKAEMLVKALDFLKEGTSVMIFPEGTRSAGNVPGFFKRGAFQLAISAGVPILPLVISGTAEILPKHGRIIKGHHRILLHVLDLHQN
jgi:1-acyl-sn-glycerol-3-phosphate acyltransferase